MRIAIVASPLAPVPPGGTGPEQQVIAELVEGLVERGHEVTLYASGDSQTRAELCSIKRPANAPLLAAWYLDNPFVFNERDPYWLVPSGLPAYDHSFVFDRGYFPQLQARGARKISFLPCACDPALYHPEPAELVRSSDLASSICFIGTFSPARGVMLESSAGIDNIAICARAGSRP